MTGSKTSKVWNRYTDTSHSATSHLLSNAGKLVQAQIRSRSLSDDQDLYGDT